MRTGKIARLPRALRDQLNRRLADGETGSRLVAWLNALPEAQTVLKTDFGGRPINEQNLSEWRQGGFEDWLRHEDACAWAAQLAEESDDLEKVSGAHSLADRAAFPALLALSGLIRQVLVSADPVEQRRTITSAAQQLTQLRRASYQAERLRLERERWEARKEEDRQNALRQAEWLRLEQERHARMKEEIRQETLFRARYVPDIHPDDISEIGLHQTESNQIKPQNPPSRRHQTHPPAPSRRQPSPAKSCREMKPSSPSPFDTPCRLRRSRNPKRAPTRRSAGHHPTSDGVLGAEH